jgi:ribosome-binding protein aMBF1 (putative translation factor)
MKFKPRAFIIEARKLKEWSQKDLADRMNSKQQTVSDHECGCPVDPYTALRYMEVLGLKITLEDFYRNPD